MISRVDRFTPRVFPFFPRSPDAYKKSLKVAWRKKSDHRRTGTQDSEGVGGERAVSLLPEKRYTTPEGASAVQTHSESQ